MYVCCVCCSVSLLHHHYHCEHHHQHLRVDSMYALCRFCYRVLLKHRYHRVVYLLCLSRCADIQFGMPESQCLSLHIFTCTLHIAHASVSAQIHHGYCQKSNTNAPLNAPNKIVWVCKVYQDNDHVLSHFRSKSKEYVQNHDRRPRKRSGLTTYSETPWSTTRNLRHNHKTYVCTWNVWKSTCISETPLHNCLNTYTYHNCTFILKPPHFQCRRTLIHIRIMCTFHNDLKNYYSYRSQKPYLVCVSTCS